MFNSFVDAVRNLLSRLRPWVIICPWQQAVRVRLGKWQRVLGPGLHLRIPWADLIFVQSVRLRITALGRQTVTTTDGHTLTFCGAVGYSITNIAKLYTSMHHPDDTILNIAKAAIGAYVWTNRLADCAPKAVQKAVVDALDLDKFGITVSGIYLTDFAAVRTYRLITNDGDYQRGMTLQTDSPAMQQPAAPTEGYG